MTAPLLVDASVTPSPARATPSLHAFLELAFRPLYLAGAAWALIAIGIWIYAPQLLAGPLQGIAWHAHEMLWGFIATIAVGFLMTAGANWTGINPLKGGALGSACVLWVGRAHRLPRRWRRTCSSWRPSPSSASSRWPRWR